MPVLEHECDDCRGTGLYSGMCEGPGVAVICLGCDGTGKAKFSYRVFTQRKPAKGIKTVRRSRGSFIATGVGPKGGSITYAEFKEGKMPPQ